ncbi:MAG: alpha/beta hydrolase [Bacteroidales bacterium]
MHPYKIVQKGTPLEEADNAMIFIHGRGAPPEDILSLSEFFAKDNSYIVAPEAYDYTWYPYSFLAPESNNQPWLDSAIKNITQLIETIAKKVPFDKIFIMGFSQGACLTSEIVARNAKRYAGIGIFTGGLIGEVIDEHRYKGDFSGTPVYLSNGDSDPHIPLHRTEKTAEIMTRMGAELVKEIFPGRPHTIQMNEIQKVKELFHL